MKNTSLCIIWGMLYALCALLGFLPPTTGFMKVLMLLCSLAFFIPGGILLYDALRQKNRKMLRALRIISASSLILTLAILVANFLVVLAAEWVGNLFYTLLVLVSVPMVSSGYWVLSLFLWACLLMATFLKPGKK